MDKIKTYVVNGFLESGKTTYISKSIARDFFYKRGTTLIISFEEGEAEYDEKMLAERRTNVVYYEGGKDITAFCLSKIEEFRPDRIYLETNAMNEALWERLPECFDVVYTIALISGENLSMYYNNMRAYIKRMIESANMVVFNRLEKENLADYATGFRLMNNKCDYLWQSSMGYSEKAFGVFLPFDLKEEKIEVTEEAFQAWYLDGMEHPEHYEGKKLVLDCQVDERDYLELGHYIAGRLVMTCCLADIQFLGFVFENTSGLELKNRCWVHIEAVGKIHEDIYHQKSLRLEIDKISLISPAGSTVIGMNM